MSYVNKALATPDLTESTAKNVVIVVTSPVFPNIIKHTCAVHDHNQNQLCISKYYKTYLYNVHDHHQEHMMLVTRLKCAGGLADLMTRKWVQNTNFGMYSKIDIELSLGSPIVQNPIVSLLSTKLHTSSPYVGLKPTFLGCISSIKPEKAPKLPFVNIFNLRCQFGCRRCLDNVIFLVHELLVLRENWIHRSNLWMQKLQQE